MPANNMATQTSEIEIAASNIRIQNDTFTTAYQAVFKQFDIIDAAWDGDDNAEFNMHVMLFKKDFYEMTAFMEKVERHLILSAKAYKTVEAAGNKTAEKLAK